MSALDSLNSFYLSDSKIEFLISDSDKTYEKELEKNFFSSKVFNFSDSYGVLLSSSTSTQSSIEKSHIELIANKAAKKAEYLISLSQKDEFVEGEVSAVEIYLEALYKESPNLFSETFQKCWLKLYLLNNASVLADFISIISAIEYDWLSDKADVLVLAGCAHSDTYVNEATLRAIEAWEQPSHIEYLSNIRQFESSWLEEYRMEVIRHIEGCDELSSS